jgi:hypothetical protein
MESEREGLRVGKAGGKVKGRESGRGGKGKWEGREG